MLISVSRYRKLQVFNLCYFVFSTRDWHGTYSLENGTLEVLSSRYVIA